MNLSRRSFLGGVLTTVGTTIIRSLPFIPQIIGDGIHNDGPGLNALLRGKPVHILTECARVAPDGEIHIIGGKFLTKEEIIFSNETIRSFWSHCHIVSEGNLEAIFRVEQNNHFDMYNSELEFRNPSEAVFRIF